MRRDHVRPHRASRIIAAGPLREDPVSALAPYLDPSMTISQPPCTRTSAGDGFDSRAVPAPAVATEPASSV
jgi:hypothetical protein